MSTQDVTIDRDHSTYGEYDRAAEEVEMLSHEQRMEMLPRIVNTVKQHTKAIREIREEIAELRRNNAVGRHLGGTGAMGDFQ